MKKSKINRFAVIGLQLTVFLLLLCASTSLSIFDGQAWGAVDTLQPVADGDRVDWDHTGCDPSERYDCVNDPPGHPDCETTYAHTSVALKDEFFQLDSTFVSDIDSLVCRINAKKTGDETAKLYVGFAVYTETFWVWETRDSITLTDSWANYSVMEDEIQPGYPWTYEYINERRFGVRSVSEAPSDSFGNTSATTVQSLTTNYISLFRYQATFTGTIDTLAIYYTGSPDGNCKLAIYSDSGTSPPGYPYELLDATAEFSLSSGWNRPVLANGNVSVTEDDYYWMALRTGTTYDSSLYEAGPYANSGRYRGLAYSDPWPDPALSTYIGIQQQYRLLAIDGPNAWGSQLTQVFLIVYSTEAEEEEVSGRRRKILQLMGQ